MLPNLTEKGAVPSKSKIRVTILLDQDVLAYFKTKTQEPGVLPYQTQINQALRQVMEAETGSTSALKSALLNDADFIRAVAREAKKLEPGVEAAGGLPNARTTGSIPLFSDYRLYYPHAP